MIDWSYDLLSEQERTLFRRLSIFAGGFTLKAAESICSGPGEPLDVLDLLAHLVHRSLVIADGQPHEVHYRLLESVQQYGREKLHASGEESDVRRRHCAWHLELAEHAEPLLAGADQIFWLDRLETDHDDLRIALEWASAGTDDAQMALRLASALGWFWEIRGYLSEGRKWLERALQRANGADPTLRVKALYTAGRLAQEQGDYAAAQAFCSESLRISREIGHRRGIARSLRVLGSQAMVKVDYPAARAMYEESLSILRELDDKGGIAWSLRQLGAIALGQGDDAGAYPLLDESLRIARDIGARRIVAAALVTLGHLARVQGDHRRAACLYRESLALLKDVRDKPSVASRMEGLAAVAHAKGQLARAARLYGVAEAIRATIGAALPPTEKAEHDRSVSALRHVMDAASFAAAWSEGQAMTIDEGVEYALKIDVA